jgi:hypothetical protein
MILYVYTRKGICIDLNSRLEGYRHFISASIYEGMFSERMDSKSLLKIQFLDQTNQWTRRRGLF